MFSLNRTLITGNSQRVPVTGSTVGGAAGGGNFSTGATLLNTDYNYPLLTDFINVKDPKALNSIFREIYTLDPVCGPSIDMLAQLPWSEYDLMGVDDPKVKQIYEDSLNELDFRGLMTLITTSYYVLGNCIGSLIFDSSRGIFTDCLFHDPDFCEITPIPMVGYDPKIDVKLSDETVKFLKSKDKRDLEALSEIGPDMLKKLTAGGKIELEPISTLYVSRRSIPGIDTLSYLYRVVPIWIMEKALMRGTIMAANRRQRGILHIQMGSDEWIPTEDQYSSIAQLFANADRDPQGAVVVTRTDIQTSEVRQPTDFWRVGEDSDLFTNAKLRALSLSESFLSSEATYSNSESGIMMFMENLNSLRERLTASVAYNRLFLLLAKYHGFRKRTQAELAHNVRYDLNSKKIPLTASRNLAESAAYNIPQIKWTKELLLRGDSNALQALQTAKEMGLPTPLALIASNSGYNIDTILDSLSRDIEHRKRVKDYQDKLKKAGITGDEEEEGGGRGGMFGSVSSNIDTGDPAWDDDNEDTDVSIDSKKTRKALLNNSVRTPEQLLSIHDKDLVQSMVKDITTEIKLNKRQAKGLYSYLKRSNL